MDLQGYGTVGALAISGIALVRGFLRSGGEHAAEIAELKGKVRTLEARTDKMQGALESIAASLSALPELRTQVGALDRFMTFRMDNLEQQVRAIATQVNAPITLPRQRRGEGGPH